MLPLFLVALIWGTTNPLIKCGSAGLQRIRASSSYRAASPLHRLLLEVRALGTTWRYLLPLLANLSGSGLFFLCLANASTARRGAAPARS